MKVFSIATLIRTRATRSYDPFSSPPQEAAGVLSASESVDYEAALLTFLCSFKGPSVGARGCWGLWGLYGYTIQALVITYIIWGSL